MFFGSIQAPFYSFYSKVDLITKMMHLNMKEPIIIIKIIKMHRTRDNNSGMKCTRQSLRVSTFPKVSFRSNFPLPITEDDLEFVVPQFV